MRGYITFYFSLGFISLIAIALSACNNISHTSSSNAYLEQARSILDKMTIEEKIGQILQADISAVTPNDVRAYHLGSILNGGNSAPGGKVTAEPEAWIALADEFWLASTDKTDGGVGIPAIWGTDAVHGHNNLQYATIFPHNSALGATHNAELVEEIGAITAREVRATGIGWTFAPTLAVARDDRWGRTYESYSEDPELVARFGKAMVLGLQGNPKNPDFLKGEHVIATAKHFIGDGGTQFGIDKGDTQGDLDTLIKLHGAGYGPAFDAKAQTVMASFSSINGTKMHGAENLLTDVLRGQMGFDGFVVGDWNGHAEVPGCTATDCLEALHAGIDMYMAPDSWKGLYESLLAHARSGKMDMARLDEAVIRILKVKLRTGLFDAGLPSTRSGTDPQILGAAKHRLIARQAVRESLVLLKNTNSALPIHPTKKVLVTGDGAHSMRLQSGGWTLNWQGDGHENADFKTGETIFEGFKAALDNHGGTAIYSQDGTYQEKPDVAIIVFGEPPYAEYRGDRTDLVYEFQNGKNLAQIKAFKAQNIPVVSVFLTGRPLWINPHLNASDAFVVAWLPGTEGGGVADVLVANSHKNSAHDFKGRLSFSWPMKGDATPINAKGDPAILYPYGFGLSYKKNNPFTPLPEETGISQLGASFDGSLFEKGSAARSFQLYLGDSSNANTPVTALSGTSLGGAVKVRGTDYKAQEDSRQITWTGNGEGSISLRANRPIDLTKYTQDSNIENEALRLFWRRDTPISAPITLSIGCGEGCEGNLDVTNIVEKLPEGQWTETAIPISCFASSGLNAKTVKTALKISTAQPASLALNSASIGAITKQVTCPASAK